MKRVTPKTLAERQLNKNKFTDLPKLKDILVDLSVKNTPKVVRKLRLIGPAMEFSEIQNKKQNVDENGKFIKGTTRFDFPDAEKNASPTRIGADDEENCPWRKMGYLASRRFAQRCVEEQEDGTWVHKILVKGPMVFDVFFDWEEGRRDEAADDPEISSFLGGDKAPGVRITALFDSSKLGNVDYTISANAKDIELTEDIINLLRAVREPSVDELNTFRAEHNEAREDDDTMPEWRDYFEYGHDIRRIFKHTPPVDETNSTANAPAPATASASAPVTSASDEAEVEESEAGGSDEVESEDSGLEELTW